MTSAEFSSGQGAYFRFELKKAEVGFFSSCSGLSSELSVVKHKSQTKEGKQVETSSRTSGRSPKWCSSVATRATRS